MVSKSDLDTWVLEAVTEIGGEVTPLAIAKHIWQNHAAEIEQSGDLFFTWQYDARWAVQNLRRAGKLVKSNNKWAAK